MKVIQEIMLSNFDAWGDAIETVDEILLADKEQEFDNLINEIYPLVAHLGKSNELVVV